jgi:hypothetical protein
MRWIMVLSEKGGTGKSTFCRALADRYRREETEALVVDGDGSVGQLLQFYGERDEKGHLVSPQRPETGVLDFAMAGDVRDRDQLVNMVEYGKSVVLCDLPAGSITFLRRIERELGLFDLLDTHGYRMTLANVISPYRASTRTVIDMIELGGDRADYVVVENRWFGGEGDYVLWHGNVEGFPPSRGKQMLQQRGGAMLILPKLEGRTCALIDMYNLPYSQAATDPRLPLADRSRVHRWLKLVDNEINTAAGVLGIGKS